MSSTDSVTQWIEQLRSGDADAAAKLWQRYYQRLLRFAEQKLHGTPRRTGDEEDVVVEAFASFCRAAQNGRFPDLRDRDDLWHLIVRITERRAIDRVREQRRQKRGGGKVLGESAIGPMGSDSSRIGAGIENIAAPGPTPQMAVETAEEVGKLLAMLDADLKRVALLKLEGFTNPEIAAAIDRSRATVERRLKYIRTIWEQV
jgi:RNA polymerase sigma factor (sigma-70 family)